MTDPRDVRSHPDPGRRTAPDASRFRPRAIVIGGDAKVAAGIVSVLERGGLTVLVVEDAGDGRSSPAEIAAAALVVAPLDGSERLQAELWDRRRGGGGPSLLLLAASGPDPRGGRSPGREGEAILDLPFCGGELLETVRGLLGLAAVPAGRLPTDELSPVDRALFERLRAAGAWGLPAAALVPQLLPGSVRDAAAERLVELRLRRLSEILERAGAGRIERRPGLGHRFVPADERIAPRR